jgi:hypothetical protein
VSNRLRNGTDALVLGPYAGNMETEYTIICIHNDLGGYKGSCIKARSRQIQSLARAYGILDAHYFCAIQRTYTPKW